MSSKLILAFLEQTQKGGLHHELAEGYLRKVLADPEYAAPFAYYVRYDAAAHLALRDADELRKLLTAESAAVIARGELRAAGGDPSGYSSDLPAICRAYTGAIVKLTEAVAESRQPQSEEPILEEAMRDFAHDLHWLIGGASAKIFDLTRAERAS
mgnify:CR=1 FL=1